MANKKRTQSRSKSPSVSIVRVVPQAAPRQIAPRRAASVTVIRRAAPARRSLFAGLPGFGGRLPVAATVQGAGGGVLAGVISDVLDKVPLWTPTPGQRALATFGIGVGLAWATGMPSNVVAGVAGAAARKYYDDKTST